MRVINPVHLVRHPPPCHAARPEGAGTELLPARSGSTHRGRQDEVRGGEGARTTLYRSGSRLHARSEGRRRASSRTAPRHPTTSRPGAPPVPRRRRAPPTHAQALAPSMRRGGEEEAQPTGWGAGGGRPPEALRESASQPRRTHRWHGVLHVWGRLVRRRRRAARRARYGQRPSEVRRQQGRARPRQRDGDILRRSRHLGRREAHPHRWGDDDRDHYGSPDADFHGGVEADGGPRR